MTRQTNRPICWLARGASLTTGGVVCPFQMCNAWDGNPKAQQYHNSGGCGGYGGGFGRGGGYGGGFGRGGGYGGGCGDGKVGVSNI